MPVKRKGRSYTANKNAKTGNSVNVGSPGPSSGNSRGAVINNANTVTTVNGVDTDDLTFDLENAGILTDVDDIERFRSDIFELSLGDPNSLPPAVTSAGVDPYRPDIVALLDFLPLYDSENEPTINRRLIEIRRAMADLKVENVEDALAAIEAEDIEGSFSILKESYRGEEENIKTLIEALASTLQVMQSARSSLDLRSRLTLYNNLKSIFINELGFSEESFNACSNSKLLGQIIVELKFAMTNHSYSVFAHGPYTDVERQDDLNFSKYSSPYRTRPAEIGQSVNLAQLSRGNMGDPGFFESWQSGNLSPLGNQTITFMAMALSRELGGSVGISKLARTTIETRYDISNKGLNNLMGHTNPTIFSTKSPPNSLASLLLLEAGNVSTSDPGSQMLPFETRAFRSLADMNSEPSAFLPGANYLVDNILKDPSNLFNHNAYTNFIGRFTRTVSDVETAVSAFTGINPPGTDDDRTYQPETIFNRCLREFSKLPDASRDATMEEKAFAVHAGLFSAARNYGRFPTLKYWLFRYFLLYDLHVQLGMAAAPGPGGFVDEVDADDNPNPDIEIVQQLIGDQLGRINQLAAGEEEFGAGHARTTRDGLENIIASGVMPYDSAIYMLSSMLNSMRDLIARLINDQEFDGIGSTELEDEGSNVLPVLNIPEEDTNQDLSVLGKFFDSAQLRFRAPTNIFQAMSNVYSQLVNSSQAYSNDMEENVDEPSQVLEGESRIAGRNIGRTKLNSMPSSSQLWMIFEIFFELAYTHKTYRLNEVNSSISKFVWKTEDNSASANAIIGMVQRRYVNSDQYQALSQIRYRCHKDTHSISKLVGFLGKFANSLREASDTVQEFFNLEGTSLSSTKKVLKGLAASEQGRTILSMLTPAQLMLYKQCALTMTADSYRSSSYLPASRIQASINEQKVINSVLRAPHMAGHKATNVRTMVVGLPHGMMESLFDPPPVLVEPNSTVSVHDNRKDLVKINVYKRDPQFPSIKFKPRSFLFDPTLFIDSSSFNAIDFGEIFNRGAMVPANNAMSSKLNAAFSGRIPGFYARLNNDGLGPVRLTKMYEDGSSVRKTAKQLAFDNPYREVLTNRNDVDIMLHNHLVDYAMKRYYSIMFGLNIEEFTFPVGVVDELRVDADGRTALELAGANDATAPWLTTGDLSVENILQQAAAGGSYVADLSHVAHLMSPTNSGPVAFQVDTDDVLPASITAEQLNNFRFLCSSNIFGATQMKRQIMTPKLFERVFMIPIDPDDFIIDKVAMGENMTDGEIFTLFHQLTHKGLIEDVPEDPQESRFRTRNLGENYVTTSEFFVTTEAGKNLGGRFITFSDSGAEVDLVTLRESAQDVLGGRPVMVNNNSNSDPMGLRTGNNGGVYQGPNQEW